MSFAHAALLHGTKITTDYIQFLNEDLHIVMAI